MFSLIIKTEWAIHISVAIHIIVVVGFVSMVVVVFSS